MVVRLWPFVCSIWQRVQVRIRPHGTPDLMSGARGLCRLLRCVDDRVVVRPLSFASLRQKHEQFSWFPPPSHGYLVVLARKWPLSCVSSGYCRLSSGRCTSQAGARAESSCFCLSFRVVAAMALSLLEQLQACLPNRLGWPPRQLDPTLRTLTDHIPCL